MTSGTLTDSRPRSRNSREAASMSFWWWRAVSARDERGTASPLPGNNLAAARHPSIDDEGQTVYRLHMTSKTEVSRTDRMGHGHAALRGTDLRGNHGPGRGAGPVGPAPAATRRVRRIS